MSPLQEHVRPLRYFLLQTVEQGDCGLDAMPFWDGSERTDKTWKALRLELAGSLKAFAYDPVWQVALAVCGEVSPGEDVHSLRNTVLDTSVDRNTLPVDKNGLDARSPNKHAPAHSERTPRTPNTEKHTHKYWSAWPTPIKTTAELCICVDGNCLRIA